MRVAIPSLRALTLAVGILLLPALAQAQSAIAGVARDDSGGVMPGVTVEASSPALIEKSRVVVTDDQGAYRIVDLRPGTYSVSFTLEGFNTFRRAGLELPSNFTATVNGELKVGSLQESITVSGSAPVVDLQSAATAQVLPRAVLDAIPTGRSIWATGQLVPGVSISAPDVGGSRGMQQVYMAVHGSETRDNADLVDGLRMNSFDVDGSIQAYFNDLMFEEIGYQTTALPADMGGGGVRINMIPKDGGNQFRGTQIINWQPGGLSADNLTDDIKAKGLSSAQTLIRNRDFNGAFGGPVKKDALWFYSSYRVWGVDQTIPNAFYNADPTHRTYSPDLSHQVVDDNLIKSGLLRLTARKGPHKLAAYIDSIVKFRGHEGNANVLEEAYGVRLPKNYYTSSAKYTGTFTSRLLLESGLSIEQNSYSTQDPEDSLIPGSIARTEITGVPGGAPAGGIWSANATPRLNRMPNIAYSWMASASYVTGSHSFKVGTTYGWGHIKRTQSLVGDLVQRYSVGKPNSVIVYNTPTVSQVNNTYDVGVYAQDSWKLNRLTINPGIRFDAFNSLYEDQSSPAGRFVPARTFAAAPESEQPRWRNVVPRLGAVFDVFGDNKTALKASWSRYVRNYTSGFTDNYNPVILSSDTRTWSDVNGDDIAQDNEIGPSTNSSFGIKSSRTMQPGLKRPSNTEMGASLQRQIVDGMSVSLSYTRRTYDNTIATRNVAVQPMGTPNTTGYTAVQIPNPADPSKTATIYNLDPALFGKVALYDYNSDVNNRLYNSWDLGFQSKLGHGTVFGGFSSSQMLLNSCDQQDPNYIAATAAENAMGGRTGLAYCDQFDYGMPYRPQFKLAGTYPLPWGVALSGSFQSNPGGGSTQNGIEQSNTIVYTLTKAQFAALAPGKTLTQTNVSVALEQPGTDYYPRINSLDLRLSKKVSFGPRSVTLAIDAFNALNNNAVTATTQVFGSSFGRVNGILPPRIIQVGGTLNF